MTRNTGARLDFIDWTRGMAAVVMLNGHTFDSFTRADLRNQQPFLVTQFLGGMPPAIFLFLTGMTYAFLMHSQERQNRSLRERLVSALMRSRFLFVIAFLFRIQLFVFGFPNSPASELLRVDILNGMGMAMLIFAPVALLRARSRAVLCACLGLLIALAAPFASQFDNTSLHWLLRAYLLPSLRTFGFFPWGAFLAFGIASGTLLRIVKPQTMGWIMRSALPLGVGLAIAAYCTPNLHLLPVTDYWLNSPALVFIKAGIVVALLGFAYLWVNHISEPSEWSLFRQLGTTSLIVYWVHIELVYGRWFGFWKELMNIPEVLLFTAFVIVLMTILSMCQTRARAAGATWKNFWTWPRTLPAAQPSQSSGD